MILTIAVCLSQRERDEAKEFARTLPSPTKTELKAFQDFIKGRVPTEAYQWFDLEEVKTEDLMKIASCASGNCTSPWNSLTQLGRWILNM